MSRSRRASTAALLIAVTALTAPSAGAATQPPSEIKPPPEKVLGSLAVEPLTGDLFTYMKVTTAGGCPGGTNTITRIFGPGFPTYGENVIGNSAFTDFPNLDLDRMQMPLTITLDEALRRQPKGTKLKGVYELRVNCQEIMPETYDEIYGVYVGRIRIKADGTYSALTTAKDLPKTPSPAAGPAARGLLTKPAPEPAAIEAAAKKLRQEADLRAGLKPVASEAKTGDSATLVALLLTGGTLALAGAGAVAANRSASSRSARRARS